MLEQRHDRFPLILRVIEFGEHPRRHFQACGQAHRLALAKQLLVEAERLGWVPSDLPRELRRLAKQRICRHDARHQVPLQRCCRIDRLGREAHLVGSGQADHPGQEPGAAIPGEDADAQEAFGELRALRSDPDVAHKAEVKARADRVAVHCGDRRHLDVVQCLRKYVGCRAGSCAASRPGFRAAGWRAAPSP